MWGVLKWRELSHTKAMAQAKRREELSQDEVDGWLEMIREASDGQDMLTEDEDDG